MKTNIFYGYSDTGGRENQEDSFGTLPSSSKQQKQPTSHSFGSAGWVADGVGGQDAGEVASGIVSRVLGNELMAWPESQQPDQLFDMMSLAIAKAHHHILNDKTHHPKRQGMATTLAWAFVDDDLLHLAWVGDSRAYLYRNNQLIRLSTDHSIVEEMVIQGLLTPKEADDHPDSNWITRAVGGSNAQPDGRSIVLRPNDELILTSDGVWEKLIELQVAHLLDSFDRNHVPLDQRARLIVQAAVNAGTCDNATALFYKHELILPSPVSRFYQQNLANTISYCPPYCPSGNPSNCPPEKSSNCSVDSPADYSSKNISRCPPQPLTQGIFSMFKTSNTPRAKTNDKPKKESSSMSSISSVSSDRDDQLKSSHTASVTPGAQSQSPSPANLSSPAATSSSALSQSSLATESTSSKSTDHDSADASTCHASSSSQTTSNTSIDSDWMSDKVSVGEMATNLELVVTNSLGQTTIEPVTLDDYEIGRGEHNTLAIPDDPYMDHQHVSLHRIGDGIELMDQGSQNGTYVCIGTEPFILKSGDEFFIGSTKICVREVKSESQKESSGI